MRFGMFSWVRFVKGVCACLCELPLCIVYRMLRALGFFCLYPSLNMTFRDVPWAAQTSFC